MLRSSNGFTLIELMVVIGVISILAAVGYPNYTEYVKKTRRSEIAALLIEEAQKLERFHSRNGQYTDVAGLPARDHQVADGNTFYALAAQRTEQTFVLTATATGALMQGDKCGHFVLENTGRRDNLALSGDASVLGCWGR
ncbi:MAG TPA: type IV pilin protein [Pseudomonas sp.]|uniref:type IV pilin protein n=1 Tax=Pseudomonas sp. TaxID=306 RepID=UPI002ED95141